MILDSTDIFKGPIGIFDIVSDPMSFGVLRAGRHHPESLV